MINFKELRCDNLIYKRDKLFKVDQTNLLTIARNPIPYSPVNISEEILLKVGFVNEFSNSWSNHVLQIFKNTGNVAGSDIGDFYVSTGQRYVTSFKHLHQLQNLYFALTGKELNTTGL